MALRPWQSGGIAVMALAGAARGAVAFGVFRPNDTTTGHTTSCGAMTWRSMTTVRKSVFDPSPRLAHAESVVDVNGERLVDDVAQWRCAMAGDLSTVAFVVRRSDARTLTAFDGASGTVLGSWRADAPIASLSVSPEADRVALVSSDDALSVLDVHSAAPPRHVARQSRVLSSSVAWSHDGDMCWIVAARADDTDQPAELFCAKRAAEARAVAHATWLADGIGAPYIAFDEKGAHLCGDAMRPRDVECRWLERPRE